MADAINLSPLQLDALRESGNIGCSHAATAVSRMINRQINISVPEIEIKKTSEILLALNEFVDEKQSKEAIGVYLELTLTLKGGVLFFFTVDSAFAFVDLLFKKPIGTTKEIGEIERSAIMELGNIVVSSYTNALGKFLNTSVLLTPPNFVQDVPEQVFGDVQKMIGTDTSHAVVFDTNFRTDDGLFNSYFVLLPAPNSLDTLIEKLDLEQGGGRAKVKKEEKKEDNTEK